LPFSDVFKCFSDDFGRVENRAGRTSKSRTNGWVANSQNSFTDCLMFLDVLPEQDKAYGLLCFFGCSTGCYGFSDAFSGVFSRRFQCFAKQTGLWVYPESQGIEEESSRSQGTTTIQGGVCSGFRGPLFKII